MYTQRSSNMTYHTRVYTRAHHTITCSSRSTLACHTEFFSSQQSILALPTLSRQILYCTVLGRTPQFRPSLSLGTFRPLHVLAPMAFANARALRPLYTPAPHNLSPFMLNSTYVVICCREGSKRISSTRTQLLSCNND